MAEHVPSVGRIVHYVAYGTPGGEFPAGVHRAAIITEVYATPTPSNPDGVSTDVGLVVLNPTGQFFNRHIQLDSTGQTPGTWHWPEYVPAKGNGS
ncbi:MAG: hypothetical protein M3R61_01475 [Chloroflexota bacterium]|nr:hypothetical protein [Chloroflexota bacterium]